MMPKMRTRIIERDLDGVLALTQVKEWLRLDATDEDGKLERNIQAAIARLDGPGGWLGVAISYQLLEGRLDHFPYPKDSDRGERAQYGIRLPFPPFIEIDSIKYIDPAGAEQTLVEGTDYRILPGPPAWIVPTFGKTWPSTREEDDAVRVRWRAGMIDASGSPETVNDALSANLDALRDALCLMVGDVHHNREGQIVGTIAEINETVDNLLMPMRRWFI
jgi:hypothetical protein